jgi:hypothetical protein
VRQHKSPYLYYIIGITPIYRSFRTNNVPLEYINICTIRTYLWYSNRIFKLYGLVMSKSIVTHAALGLNEYLETKVVKRGKQPNYQRIGNGTMNKHSIQSIDLVDEVMRMTKAEQLVISQIKKEYDWDNQDNEVYLQLSRILTKSECTVFRKGYSLLKAKNLARRTKTNHYMINPNAYIPLNYKKALDLWEASEEV